MRTIGKNLGKFKSFTLLELIIVLAIIAVLVVVIIAVIKPTKIFQGLRDTQRINDLKRIENSITTYETEKNGYLDFYGTSSYVYISLPDQSSTCSSWISQLPSLPSGYSYRCSATPTAIDGTGYIPINFASSSLLNLQKLPIDPINRPPYYYTYVAGGSYELTALMEKNENRGKDSISARDGGDDDFIYEVGSDKKLTPSIAQERGIAFFSYNSSYRRPVTINNTANNNNLTDYQILVTLDTASLISASKMRSDCGDIRFADSDGSTLLNYWLESGCNTNNTRIWVKVPSIQASSNKTIYLYYGNPSATSLSNGDNTFVFFDDFNDGIFNTNKWGVEGAAGSNETNGVLNTKGSGEGLVYSKWYPNSGKYCLRFRVGGTGYSAYSYTIGSGAGKITNTFLDVLGPNFGGATYYWGGWNWAYQTSYPALTFAIGDIYDVFYEVGSTTWQISKNGGTPISHTHSITLPTAGFGFRTYSTTEYEIVDYVFVRKYTSPEPTITVGAEE
ncbi:MAG: DUF2341 domain-containing protein [Minisyncoccia bacterium]